VCLGDVIGYGARPRQALDLVMALCVATPARESGYGALEAGLCLQGNHEYALLHGDSEDFNPRARAAIDWTRAELNRAPAREQGYAYWDFLAELQPLASDGRALFAHGSPRDPVREYLVPHDVRDASKMSANFASMGALRVCFVGHSHIPAVYLEGGGIFLPSDDQQVFDLERLPDHRAIVNVGSVGQPRDGDARLSYVLFDGRNVTFVRLAYDVESAQAAIRAVPELPDYLADRLAVGR
jgi:diadenosine tetraphosphatase ApaH/serine/threonine PP2A family protein phosphatase